MTNFEWDAQQRAALNLADAGESVLLRGPAGSGRTAVALEVARRKLNSPVDGGELWASALVLTPDRRRATRLDRRLSGVLGSGAAAQLTAPGSHRLVRSLDSYAYLVLSTWLVERQDPLPRPTLISGAREDGWVARFLQEHREKWREVFSESVLASPRFRMEVRNLMARSGQAGLRAADLRWLGAQAALPIWELAADVYEAYAGGEAAFTENTDHVDSARLSLIAARVLADWDKRAEEEGVIARKPVPETVVIDDLEDMPLSSVPLFAQLKAAGASVFATWSPDEAIAQFRGGSPLAGVRLAEELNPTLVQLTETHGISRSVEALSVGVEAWIPALKIGRRTGESTEANKLEKTNKLLNANKQAETSKPAAAPRVMGSASRALAQTESRMRTEVERFLRLKNLEGTQWTDMAVLVRTGEEVTAMHRALARQDVPLESGERPVVLSKVPVCAALLHLLADPPGELEEGASEPAKMSAEEEAENEQSAMDLLLSPLVGADPLDVYRALRAYRTSMGSQGLFIADMLQDPDADLGPWTSRSVGEKTRAQIKKAQELWALRAVARDLPAQEALWTLWSAAGVGPELREQAIGAGKKSSDASDILDATLALFRKADFWTQEQADLGQPITGRRFAEEILEQQVQTDPLVPSGLQSRGVSVTTPSQAAGQRWAVVVVAGVQQGSWPRNTHDGLGQVGRLQEVLEDARQRGWREEQPIELFLPDRELFARSGGFAARSRMDEARLFYSAVTRASRDLRFLSVHNEDQLSSVFLRILTEDNLLNEVLAEDEDGEKTVPIFEETPPSVGLQSKVLELRQQALGKDGDEALQDAATRALALLTAEGETLADPTGWAPGGVVSERNALFGDRKVRLSPSKLQTAANCPLRWFLETSGAADQDLTEDPLAFSYLQRGLIVHEIADKHPKGTREELREAFDVLWKKSGFVEDTTWIRRHYLDTRDMVDRIAAYYKTVDPQVKVATETDIEFEVGDALVRGRVDRIEFQPDDEGGSNPFVIDIKTGQAPTKAEAQASMQLLAYQVGLHKQGHTAGGAALWSLKSGAQGAFRIQDPLSEEEQEEASDKLSALAEELRGPELRADPENGDCRTCPFKSVCPAMPQSVRGVE